MGGDGGQVIDRATMVKTKGWGLTKENGNGYAASLGEMNSYLQMQYEDRGQGPLERHRTKMTQCWLSQQELRDPVVACKLGNLYNKEAMIGAILNKKIPACIPHVKKLSDLKNCVIQWKESKEDGLKHMVCPISREDLDSGGSRAVVIWPTGVVVGIKSLKELKSKECPVTGKPFDFDADLIALAPDDEELGKLRERLPASKKRKATPETSSEPAGEAAAATATTAPSEKAGDKKPVKGACLTRSGPAAEEGLASHLPRAAETDTKKATRRKSKAEIEHEEKVASSSLYKSLFTGDRGDGHGLTGARDGFGKPMYNRGSRCL